MGFEESGLVTLEIVVNNPGSLFEPLQVSFSCENGTAIGNSPVFPEDDDYFVNRTRITIFPGQFSTFVDIILFNDGREEGTEGFFCRLDSIPGQLPTIEFPDPGRGRVPIFIEEQG